MRGEKNDFAGFVGIAASIVLLGGAATVSVPIFEYINEAVSGTVFSTYLSTLMKAVGITVAVQFVSEICRDSGESALASKLELVGKAEILVLCLPLVEEIAELAKEILDI